MIAGLKATLWNAAVRGVVVAGRRCRRRERRSISRRGGTIAFSVPDDVVNVTDFPIRPQRRSQVARKPYGAAGFGRPANGVDEPEQEFGQGCVRDPK